MPRQITLSSGRVVTVPDAADSAPASTGSRQITLSSGRVVTVPDRAPAEPVEEDGGGVGVGAGLLGAAGLVGAGLLSRKPGMIGKGLRGANALRQQLMLSGFAAPKSVMGNVGATAIESMERGTTAPLRQLFSKRTAKDFVENWKNPALESGMTRVPGPTPGRFMGAMDTATRNAMQRAGLTAQEAEKAVLQAPLDGRLGKALDSDTARYLLPFRRTPFNQFLEGLETYKGANPVSLAVSHGAGAAHGYATADERYPASIGFGVAGAAKYGLPYTVGALAGRALGGGSDASSVASSALPVSEYGISSGVTDPLSTFRDPAALRALRKLLGDF